MRRFAATWAMTIPIFGCSRHKRWNSARIVLWWTTSVKLEAEHRTRPKSKCLTK